MRYGLNGEIITLEQDMIDVFNKHKLNIRKIEVQHMVWTITAQRKVN
jgi:hypothetical protein